MNNVSRILRKSLALTAIVLILASSLLFVTCANDTSAPSASTNVTSANETGYQIKFFLKGQQVASLGITELHSLPEVAIEMGGDTPETGPTLQSVLDLAGIKEYSKVTVSGMLKGRIATGELALQRSEITNDVILDFNNQGKTKLCGKQIPESNWIIDVAEIRAE